MSDAPISGLDNTPTATSGPDRGKKRIWWIIGALVLLLVVAIVLITVSAVHKKSPAYLVTYTSVKADGPNAAKVAIVVRNTGGSAGTPTCTLRASEQNGTSLGSGTFQESRPINPGDLTLYVNTLPISDGVAGLVKRSDISVTCATSKR